MKKVLGRKVSGIKEYLNSRYNRVNEIDKTGQELVNDSVYNKSLCFSSFEKSYLGLEGLLPNKCLSIEEQAAVVQRNLDQGTKNIFTEMQRQDPDLEQITPEMIRKQESIYSLYQLDRSLYYKVIQENWSEMSKIISIPSITWRIKYGFLNYYKPRGVYITYQDKNIIETIFDNSQVVDPQIIIITDGSKIFNLGD